MGDVVVIHIGIVDALDRAAEGVEAAVVGEVGVPLLGGEARGDVGGDLGDWEIAKAIGCFNLSTGGDCAARTGSTANNGEEFATNDRVAVGGGRAVAIFNPLDPRSCLIRRCCKVSCMSFM